MNYFIAYQLTTGIAETIGRIYIGFFIGILHRNFGIGRKIGILHKSLKIPTF